MRGYRTGSVSPADSNSTVSAFASFLPYCCLTLPHCLDQVSVFATIGAPPTTDNPAGTDPAEALGGPAGLGVQLFVANYHRLGDTVEKFQCNEKLQICERRPHGTYTDSALCDANCPDASWSRSKPSSTGGVDDMAAAYEYPPPPPPDP